MGTEWLNPWDWRNWVAPGGAAYINKNKETNMFGVAKKNATMDDKLNAIRSQYSAMTTSSTATETARQLLISGGSQKLIASSGLGGDTSGGAGSIRRRLLGG